MVFNIEITLIVLGAYLLGSISTAVIICKVFNLPDPRLSGSKNPGTTNVLRLGGKLPAIFTLIGDFLKGFIAVMLAKQLDLPSLVISLVMIAVFVGHLYPIFFHFHGGKGVATAFGVLTAFSLALGLGLASSWLLVVTCTRISSLGALVASALAIISGWLVFAPTYSLTITIIVCLLLVRHKQNIMRLIRGQEPKIGQNLNN